MVTMLVHDILQNLWLYAAVCKQNPVQSNCLRLLADFKVNMPAFLENLIFLKLCFHDNSSIIWKNNFS